MFESPDIGAQITDAYAAALQMGEPDDRAEKREAAEPGRDDGNRMSDVHRQEQAGLLPANEDFIGYC